jgi:hypothetical protein
MRSGWREQEVLMRLPEDIFAGLKLALVALPFVIGGYYLVLSGWEIVGALIAIAGSLVLLAGFVLHVAIAIDRIRAASRRRDDSRK